MLKEQIYAVIFKNAVVFAQIIIAEALVVVQFVVHFKAEKVQEKSV